MANKAGFLLVAVVAAFLAGRASVNVTLDISLPWPVIVDDAPPVPGDGKHVLFIYETNERDALPAGHMSLIDSVPFRSWLKDQGFAVRWWDKDQDVRKETDEWFAEALDVKRESVPWLVISNGRRGYSGPWPATLDEAKTLIGRFAQ